MRILKTKWFTQFATKHSISDQKLKVAIEEVESGIIDADLGGGLVKKRIAREGEGKRGGYRTIIAYRRRETAAFIFGFSKNKTDNIDAKDLASLREIASELEAMTDMQIKQLLDQGRLKEIK